MNRKIFVSALAVLAGFIIYTSCTKIDTTDIGNDLIPAVDNVNTFELVLDVVTDNFIYDDSTRISPSAAHAIGIIENDPEFGKTEAQAYFAMVPAFFGTHPFVNADSVEIDSIVLSLPFNSLYGDSTSIQEFEVYQIDPNADFTDSLYRISTTPFDVLPTPVGGRTVNFTELNDSVFYNNYTSTSSTLVDSVRTRNVLRIPLDPSFGQQFLDYDTSIYASDSIFRVNFKGLAVRVNPAASANKSALAYFNLTGNTAAQLTFYSRLTRNGQVDTIAPTFSYTGNRAQANLITRQPGNNYLAYVNNGSPTDDLVFIQSSPGSVATVKIPGLDTLDNRVIHRAELIAEKVPSAQDNFYTEPPILFIDAINEAGDSTFTIRNDFVFTGTGTNYDVNSLEGIFRNDRYAFNLSRYVQSIVTKKLPNRTLRIYAPYATWPYHESGNGVVSELPLFIFVNAPVASGRVVLGGGTHPTQKMRLRIIYSKI